MIIGVLVVLLKQRTVACSALHANGICRIHHDTRTNRTVIIYKLDVEFSMIILSDIKVKLYFQFLRVRNHSFYLCIIVRVAIG